MHKWTRLPTIGQRLKVNPHGARQSDKLDYDSCYSRYPKITVVKIEIDDTIEDSLVHFKDSEGEPGEFACRYLDRYSPAINIKFNTRKKY